jgi:hypothetical protein
VEVANSFGLILDIVSVNADADAFLSLLDPDGHRHPIRE